MPPTNYAGTLHSKLLSELKEIGTALGIDVEQRKAELREAIQEFLDANESEYSLMPQFKGLYVRKRGRQSENSGRRSESDSESESNGIASELKPAVRSARKSVNKAVDRLKELGDAVNVPLPESPVVQKVQEVANSAVVAVSDASQALVPANMPQMPKDLTLYAKQASNSVVRYVGKGQARVDAVTGPVRQYLSTPQNLILASLSLELVHIITHVSQSYNHTIFFPPVSSTSGTAGTFASLVSSAFFWSPKVQFTVRVPEWADVWGGRDEVWGVLGWWLFATVIPAAAASTIFHFGAQPHEGVTTRHQAAHKQPTYDPASFALVRLAILLWSISAAAPSSMVDALQVAGNLQGRALWAGLVGALVLAQKLQPAH